MRNIITLCAFLVMAPLAAAGAQHTATVDPGMTQAQVVAALGQPLSVSAFDGFTYMFYHNGCEERCGMHDLVTLDSGKVVDAIFRTADRKYTGASSSPQMISAVAATHPSRAPASRPASSAPPTKATKSIKPIKP